jgi:phenylalanyl-tRNA synthetase beta chain
MLVPLEWIREFIDLDMPVEEVDRTLTMLGLEVEGVEEAGGDYVLEVNVTPNRPDCLSMVGIARELSAATGRPLKYPPHEVENEKSSALTIETLDRELCPRYAGRVVRGVSAGESPGWMRERIEKCGLRPINSIVDVTNYVLLELGHPLHAFDLGTLRGHEIRVGKAGPDRSFLTLDGVDRALPEDCLLIWDAERPVAIAGVMGGAETEVTEATTDILIESAYFKPESVRRTSKALGLKTESSYRFERGADILGLEAALDRAARLVMEVAGGEAEEKVEAYPEEYKPARIKVGYGKVNRVLGTDLSNEEMLSLLERLGLETDTGGDFFVVTPPPSRPDLEMDADVIEEIARLYGYGNIPTRLPEAEMSSSDRDASRAFVSEVKEAMARGGFSEAISYSFMNEHYLDILKLPEGDGRRRCVGIKNPLRQEDALLRTTLTPSLIEMFLFNFFRGTRDVRLFEVSRVFEQTDALLPLEPLMLGGVYYSEKNALWREEAEGFYIAKGAIESLLEALKIGQYAFVPSAEPFLHAGKSADIEIAGEKAGFIGAISPGIIEHLDLKARPEVIVFELSMDYLMSLRPEALTFAPIPKYPHIERDVALLLDAGVMSSAVMDIIRAYPSDLIEEAAVFDTYQGVGIPEGKKSLAFSIRYRSRERTLTDEEVEAVHQGLIEHIKGGTGHGQEVGTRNV